MISHLVSSVYIFYLCAICYSFWVLQLMQSDIAGHEDSRSYGVLHVVVRWLIPSISVPSRAFTVSDTASTANSITSQMAGMFTNTAVRPLNLAAFQLVLKSCLFVCSCIMEFTQARRTESLTIIRFLPVMISLWLVDLLGRVPWHYHHISIKWTLCLQEWASLFLALVRGRTTNRGCSNSNLPELHPFRICPGKLWG